MATFTSNTYEGRKLQLTITESVNVINNNSTLTWVLESVGGSDLYYDTAKTTVKINGTVVYDKDITYWDNRVFPAAKGSTSGTITIAHNADGTKTNVPVEFNTAVFYHTSQAYGGKINLTAIDRKAPTVSVSLSSITTNSVTVTATANDTADLWEYSLDNKTWSTMSTTAGKSASKIISGLSSNTEYTVYVRARRKYNQVKGVSNVGTFKTQGHTLLNSIIPFHIDVAKPVFNMNCTAYGSFTHTLEIKDGNTTLVTITNILCSVGTNNVTVSLTDEQRRSILSYARYSRWFLPTFYLTTYDNGVQIGETVSQTGTIRTSPELSAPLFADFTHKDSNVDETVTLTGNDQIYVQGESSLQITIIGDYGVNYATIKSYRVTVGSESKTFTTNVIEYGVIPQSGNVAIKVEVIDSRGYSTSITKTIEVLDYQSVSVTDYLIRRVNEVESTIQVWFSGRISPLVVNDESKNHIQSAKIMYHKKGEPWSDWVDLPVSSDGYNFEFETSALSDSAGIIEFDPDSQYSVVIKVSDYLSSDVVKLTLNKGTPLLAYRSKKLGINTSNPQAALHVVGDVMINDNYIADFIIEQGVNGIWSYEKWNSGKARCWAMTEKIDFNFDNVWKDAIAFHYTTQSLPDGFFAEIPYFINILTVAVSGLHSNCVANINTQEVCWYAMSHGTDTLTRTIQFSFMIEGKWK